MLEFDPHNKEHKNNKTFSEKIKSTKLLGNEAVFSYKVVCCTADCMDRLHTVQRPNS
jgi:hypothetical protein